MNGIRRTIDSPYSSAGIALVFLLVLSVALAPGSLSGSALLSMLPFAAILAVAAVGQTLVIQQGGIDLSVPGAISLGAVVVTYVANGDDDRMLLGLLLAVASLAAAGVITGLVVAWLRVSALVVTLAMNALLLGAVLALTGGSSTVAAPTSLSSLTLGRTVGVPNTVLIAVAVVAVAAVVTTRTPFGRRFIANGVNSRAAHTAGIPTKRYAVLTYVSANVSYAIAGVMLAGFLGTPSLFSGNTYLLPTIAAVVVGGTSLLGGRGSVVASAFGALFLIQLQQVISALGAPTSVQFIVQGGVIGLAIALRYALKLRRRAVAVG